MTMTNGKACVEHSWLLVGVHRGRLWLGQRRNESTGSPCEVTFDEDAALAREEERNDLIGWFHTHPGMPATPSDRDVRTMRAWVGSLGKPLLCLIHGIDGLKGFVFADDECKGIPLGFTQRIGNLIVGVESTYGRHAPSRELDEGRGRARQARVH
jgi:hypothetical protein